MKLRRVAIVIVNWNTKDILRDCINSIYKETKGTEFEIIVVDNNSSDGSQEMIKKEFSKVKLIANKENKGFAAANNQGIRTAKGRYILLLNSDTLILDNAITKTIRFADKHPRIGITGCKILNLDKTLQRSCFMFPSILNMFLSATYLYKIFPKNRFFGRELMTWWDHNEIKNVNVVMGSFMLVKGEAIKEVGLMDEQYFMYTEETDWCCQFNKKGWKITFCPCAEIIHLGGQSSKKAKSKMTLQLRGSKLLFMKKNKTLQYPIACFLMGLWFLLRVPFKIIMLFNRNKQIKNLLTIKTYLKGFLYSWLGGKRLLIKK
jgi:GT2 family glycosyltransferase